MVPFGGRIRGYVRSVEPKLRRNGLQVDLAQVMVHALNEVDLEIAEKEVVVLLGPSGSGKTTLLNIMGGFDRPASGRLFFRDLDLTDLEDRELTKYRRDHVGFVF